MMYKQVFLSAAVTSRRELHAPGRRHINSCRVEGITPETLLVEALSRYPLCLFPFMVTGKDRSPCNELEKQQQRGWEKNVSSFN